MSAVGGYSGRDLRRVEDLLENIRLVSGMYGPGSLEADAAIHRYVDALAALTGFRSQEDLRIEASREQRAKRQQEEDAAFEAKHRRRRPGSLTPIARRAA